MPIRPFVAAAFSLSRSLSRRLSRRLSPMLLLMTFGAGAQAQAHVHTPGMSYDSATAAQRAKPTRAGQEAFVTIAEVVRILDADPRTDWSKVDLEALRQHLIDMDDVTMRSAVRVEDVASGAIFHVSGTGRTRDAIRRMTMSHGATIAPADGFTWSAVESPEGARVTVRAVNATDAKMVTRLRAIGFVGILSLGDHHTVHHIGIADGSMRVVHKH